MEDDHMCVALIGGMDRLDRHYSREAERSRIELRIFNKAVNRIASKLRGVDALVIFTNKVSHRVKNEALSIARARNIPVYLYHSCGVCTLRDCFNCIHNTSKGEQ
jgi:hypothetical protein